MINWFRNLKIFNKLIIAFMISLLMTLLIGLVGLSTLNTSNELNRLLYEKEFLTVKYLETSYSNLLYIDNYFKSKLIASTPEELKYYSDKIKLMKFDLINNYAKADPLFVTDKNKELSSKILRKIYPLSDSIDTINNLTNDINNLKDLKKDHKTELNEYTNRMTDLQALFDELEQSKFARSKGYYEEGQETVEKGKIDLLILVFLAIFISFIISFFIARIITYPIFVIRDSLKKVTEGNLSSFIDSPYKDETGEVISHFNKMIESLSDSKKSTDEQSWLKDGLNQLTSTISGDNDLKTLSEKSISFLSKYIEAGAGVIYRHDEEENKLRLISSYAFTQRDNISNEYKFGEGIIGQTAIEKSPILLKNVSKSDMTISSGTVSEPPVNIYAVPLVFEDEVLGVIELASFKVIDKLTQDFINQASKIISTNIYSTVQSDKVKKLLVIAEISQKEAQEKAYEVQKMNAELEEQQQQLQLSAKQMQQANAQLEEQQQQLQQQTEELRQSNSMLELQKEQVQKKEEEARLANIDLLKAKSDLDDRAEQLEISNKYKSEFLANMSHELRTPLNSIILLSQILSRNKNENLIKEDVEKVKVINNAGNELLKLINDILDLSKIEAGKMTLDIREFNLNEILEEQAEYFNLMANEKGLRFKIENKFNKDVKVKSDSQKVSQIIRNFLSNAFKFTKEGSITIIIDKSENPEKPLKISVKDTGIGVSPDKHRIIFQAFSQADGSTSRVYGGTGLGLSIASELAKLLKGEVMLESKEGQGSTFSLLIPYSLGESLYEDVPAIKEDKPQILKPVEKKEIKPVVPDQNIIVQVQDDKNNIFTGDKVVLIIEDDLDFANSVKYVNQDLNLKSIIALNGRDGLDYALRYKPDAIILDLGLPDINGIEVLHELKTTRELKHIPVHIISGNDKEKHELQRDGALGFKQKPLSEDDLTTILTNMINFTEKKDKKVLVVEDNAQQLMAITELIKENNILCKGVKTQSEAIEEINKGIYSVLIVDLNLREGSGYEISDYVRKNNIDLPIIIYTAKELSREEESELQKVSDTIVLKTVYSGERLIDEISMFLHIMNKDENKNYINSVSTIKKELEIPGKTILVVDDDIKNTYVITAALEQTKACILYAKNGKESIEVVEQNPNIDLILMDIMMPVMNGYEAIEAIKADPAKKHIPVIAVTAKALKDDKLRCFEVGANDYLTKPIDFDVLLNIVEKWINKKV